MKRKYQQLALTLSIIALTLGVCAVTSSAQSESPQATAFAPAAQTQALVPETADIHSPQTELSLLATAVVLFGIIRLSKTLYDDNEKKIGVYEVLRQRKSEP